MPSTIRYITTLTAASVIAVGMAAAGKFAGDGGRGDRVPDRYVTAQGFAERDVTADLAVWTIRVTATGDDLGAVQSRIDRSVDSLTVFLAGEGIGADSINRGTVQVTDLLARADRSDGAGDSRYVLEQAVVVRTAEVEKVEEAASRIGELVKLGVVLTDSGGPAYLFTGLNDVRSEMIAEAGRDARSGAEQLVAGSGSRVGAIRRASHGAFSVDARDGSGPGGPETTVDKQVRVVSTVEFFLED